MHTSAKKNAFLSHLELKLNQCTVILLQQKARWPTYKAFSLPNDASLQSTSPLLTTSFSNSGVGPSLVAIEGLSPDFSQSTATVVTSNYQKRLISLKKLRDAKIHDSCEAICTLPAHVLEGGA